MAFGRAERLTWIMGKRSCTANSKLMQHRSKIGILFPVENQGTRSFATELLRVDFVRVHVGNEKLIHLFSQGSLLVLIAVHQRLPNLRLMEALSVAFDVDDICWREGEITV